MRRLTSLLLPHGTSLQNLVREAERAALMAGLDKTLYTTDFARRAAHLQRRCAEAASGPTPSLSRRREAQCFLDAEVPKQDVNTWLEQGGNAIALCQVLQRFDLRPDATLSALLVNKLVRTAEDTTAEALPRLHAMDALTALRQEENYERAFSVVEDVLKSIAAKPTESSSPGELLRLLELAARVLQRCGKRVPTLLGERVVHVTMTVLQRCSAQDCHSSLNALLQVYEWMAQSEFAEAGHVLYALLQHVSEFTSAQLARVVRVCVEHDAHRGLSVETLLTLARASLVHAPCATFDEMVTMLDAMHRILRDLADTTTDVDVLVNGLHAMLEEYQTRVLDYLDESDESRTESVLQLASLYLLGDGGVLRYRAVSRAVIGLLARTISTLSPAALLTAARVLQRVQLLSLCPSAEDGEELGLRYGTTAAALHTRLAQLLPQLSRNEMAALCALAATLPSSTNATARVTPGWWEEARAVWLRQSGEDDMSGLARLQLALVFSAEETGSISCTGLALEELVPLLPLALNAPAYASVVLNALLTQLAEPIVRVSVDALRWMLAMRNAMLAGAVNAYLYRHLMQPVWSSRTVCYLALLPPGQAASGAGCDPHKAVAAVTTAALTPALLVTLLELLCAVYGEVNESTVNFVQTSSERVVKDGVATVGTVVRLLAVLRPHPRLHPSPRWLSELVETRSPALATLTPAQLESLLVSLHTIYTDTRTTPALQVLLWELVTHHPVLANDHVDDRAARTLVLLAYLQQGLTLPLLTRQTPWVTRVLAQDATYAPEVRTALQTMPLPAAPDCDAQDEATLRFTLASETTQEVTETTAKEESSTSLAPPTPTPTDENVTEAATETVVTEESTGAAAEPAVEAAAEAAPTSATPTLPSYFAFFNRTTTPGTESVPTRTETTPPSLTTPSNTTPATSAPPSSNAPLVNTVLPGTWGGTATEPSAANTAWPATASYHIPSRAQNAALFGSLFTHATDGTTASVASRPTTTTPILSTPSAAPSTVTRTPVVGGNNIFFNPATLAARGERLNGPPRKAVMTRLGGRYAEDTPFARTSTPAAGSANETSTSSNAGRVTGYNMNHVVDEPVRPAASPPLVWQEAARAVSRISRHGKPNQKPRGQQSLSDWLSTPTQSAPTSLRGRPRVHRSESAAPELTKSPASRHRSRRPGRPHEDGAAAAASTATSRTRATRKTSSTHPTTATVAAHGVNGRAGRRGGGKTAAASTATKRAGGHHGTSSNAGATSRKSAKKVVKEVAKRAAPTRKAPARKPKHGKKR